MRKLSLLVSATLVVSSLLCSSASASTITVGTDTINNTYPFSLNYAGEYQQVYNAASFGGVVLITGITFFTLPGSNAISGSYVFDLSNTSASSVNAPGGLNTAYATNIGSNNTQFFSGTVANVSSFTGTPFLYDPSKGNLLLDIDTLQGGNIQSLAAGCSPDTNRVWNFAGTGAPVTGLPACGAAGFGLETQFTVVPQGSNAVTPEPSSFVLLGTGILAAAARRRLRTK